MDFKKFITEETKKTAVMAFGRFNPVTTGHEKLMHKVHDTAKKVGGEAHIIASHSEGDARNPIPHKKKLEYIKKVAKPGTHVSGSSKEAPSKLPSVLLSLNCQVIVEPCGTETDKDVSVALAATERLVAAV